VRADRRRQELARLGARPQSLSQLFADLALARGDGRYARILRALGGVQLLILDDWGLEPLNAAARHDLLEILEEITSPALGSYDISFLSIPPGEPQM
jgi:IstB-like ATP binding protein